MTQFPSTIIRAAGTYSTDANIDLVNPGAAGLVVVVDLTDEDTGGGAGAMVVTIQGFDQASGKVWTILASASLAAVATTVMRVHFSLPASDINTEAQDILPPRIRININHTNANPMVYSIGAHFTA